MLTVLCQLYGARKFILGDGADFNYLQVDDDVWAIRYKDTVYYDTSRMRTKTGKKIMGTYLSTVYGSAPVKCLCRDANDVLTQYEGDLKCCSISIWTRIGRLIKSLVS